MLERIKTEEERLIKEDKIKRSKKSGSSDTLHYENVPFEVPSSWVWCRLGGLCNKFSTGPFGSMVHKSDYINNTGLPLINPANIIDGIISLDKVVYITESKANELERYKLEENDILLARRGDLSKCAIVEYQHLDAYCGTGSFVLHLENMNPKFFSIIYTSTYLQTILKSECVGATMDNLNQGVLSSILVPFPPMDEQYRIVTEIEKWFTLIDALEADSTDLQTLITRIKSKILDLAIHGKLVSQDPHDEPAVELLKRINPDFTPCDNEHSRKLPQNWCICRLKDLCSFLSRGKSPKYSENDKTYPVFAQKCNFKDGGISLEQARFLDPSTICKWSETYKLRTGDILVNSTGTGTVGRTRLFHESYLGQYPFVVPDSHVSVIRVIDDIIPQYLYAYISSSFIQRYLQDSLAGSTNQKELYIGVLENLVIFVPPFIEQQRIVQKIEELFTSIDEIQKALEV